MSAPEQDGGTLAGLSKRQMAWLDRPIARDLVFMAPGSGGAKYETIKHTQVVNQANAVFGYGNWGKTIEGLQFTPLGDPGRGEGVYQAIVTVTVCGCQPHTDVGVALVLCAKDRQAVLPSQHELGAKSAVSDALKRALYDYGDQFGNNLDEEAAGVGAMDHPWRRPLRATEEEIAAVEQLAEADPEGASKIKEPLEMLSPVQLTKLIAWFRQRAEAGRAGAGAEREGVA